MPGAVLMIGLDTGRHPAAVLGQMAPLGRLLLLASRHAENMGMELFLTTELLPLLSSRFANLPSYLIMDPACRQRSRIGGGASSVLPPPQLRSAARADEQSRPAPARWRNSSSRSAATAAILFDPSTARASSSRCSRLPVQIQKDGKTLDEAAPEKNHPWSDLADAAHIFALARTAPSVAAS